MLCINFFPCILLLIYLFSTSTSQHSKTYAVGHRVQASLVDVLVEPADGCSVAGCFTIPADCIIYSLTSMNNEVPPKLIFLI
jgi:hypothetical protein